jgi:hypothetical protein
MVRNLIGNVGANSGTVYRQYAESNYRTFTTRGQNKNFAPLIMVGPEGHESAMAVQNTAEQEVSFTIRFYVQGGGIVARSPVQTLPPSVMKVFRAGDFLPNFLKSSATGFLGSAVVQVDSPASMGTVTLISQLVAPYGAESHEGIPEGTYWYQKRAEVIDLPLVRNQRWQEKAEWNSEINVVNMGTTQEEVWIQYHEQDGKLSFTSIRKRVSPDSVLNFWGVDQLPDPVPPNLFKGSGKAEGSQQKRLGAAVQVIRWGKETVSRPDFLLGYSAWW